MGEEWRKLEECLTAITEIWLKEYLTEEWWQKEVEEIRKPEDLYEYAELFFDYMEKQIDREHEKAFVTDNLENALTRFLCSLIAYMAEEGIEGFFEPTKHENSFNKLCSHRHVGYAFYKEYTKTEKFLCEYKGSAMLLYKSMLEYYRRFYGRFADNEEAIELICKYYKKEWDEKIKPDSIADALESHVHNAGEPNNLGYAYHGIGLIRRYFYKIPEQAIFKLLSTYKYEMFWHNDVYRNQIVSIIYGGFRERWEEGSNYKWRILDARYIMHIVTDWIEKYMLPKFTIDYEYLYESTFDAKEILVLKSIDKSENCKQEVRWKLVTLENVVCWSLVLEDNGLETVLLTISLEFKDNSECSKINLIACDGNKKSTSEFPFALKDYQMENMKPKRNRRKISEWIEENLSNSNISRIINTNAIASIIPSPDDFNYSILISNLWINNYRTVKEKTLSFDGKYEIKNDSGKIIVSDSNQSKKIPESFFGKNIYSLSAIIGKNGSGKTTIIDFIRENFYQLLHLINVGLVQTEDNIVPPNLAIPHDAEFMVIFKVKTNAPSIQEKTYYLTNCEHDCKGASDITAYKKTLSSSAMLETYSKAFYFSNMFSDRDTFHILERENYIQALRLEFSKKELEENKEQYEELKAIRGRYTCNCSVDYIFQQKLSIACASMWDDKNIDLYNSLIYNWEWIKLVYFLCNVPNEKFNQWFDNKLEKDDITFYRTGQVEKIRLNYSEGVEGAFQTLKSYIRKPIEICGLSSGQYAKLMYLSRLCWSLRAYENDRKVIEKMLKELYDNDNEGTSEQNGKYSEVDFLSLLRDSDTVSNGNTYMIFIDEGELYYHPEWQRTFIKTLLDIMEDVTIREDSIQFQIVVTSNSPFIISDIPQTNILFLTEENQEFENTFGLNIHTLLVDNFFMDATIGEFAREKIKEINNRIKELELDGRYYFDSDTGRERLMCIQEQINLVGEPMIRRQLQKRFDRVKMKERSRLQATDKINAIMKELNQEERSKLYEQLGRELKDGGKEEHD